VEIETPRIKPLDQDVFEPCRVDTGFGEEATCD